MQVCCITKIDNKEENNDQYQICANYKPNFVMSSVPKKAGISVCLFQTTEIGFFRLDLEYVGDTHNNAKGFGRSMQLMNISRHIFEKGEAIKHTTYRMWIA